MSAKICLWSLVRQSQCIFLGFNPFRDQLRVVNPNTRLKWFSLSGIRPGAAGDSITHFFGVQSIYVWFIIAQMSRRDSKGSNYARLWTLFQVGQFTERRSENFATKLHSKGFSSFSQSFVQITHELAMPSLYRHNMITVHASSIKPGLATNYPGKPIPFQRPTKCFATVNSGSRFRNARNKFSGSTVTFHSTQAAFERSAATNCTHQLHDS